MTPLRAYVATCALTFTPFAAMATNAQYQKQLERSGCTQVTELQGCDIRKSKAENAKAGFGTAPQTATAGPRAASNAANPYAGQWVAKGDNGATVATIRIDRRERVWVNGNRVTAKRADGGLMFKSGPLTFMIQGDRRLKNEDYWIDADAGTRGRIQVE